MRDLKERASKSSCIVGTKEEMTLLRKRQENVSNFWTEIRTTTKVHVTYRGLSARL